MKRIFIALLLIFSSLTLIKAQIGVNTDSPDPSSILDINDNTKGILIPRLTTTEKEAIVDPAFSLLVYDTSLACYSQFDGTKWKCLNQLKQAKWFYMPSIAINTENISTADETVDLYSEYTKQFIPSDNTTSFKSDGAPKEIPYFLNPTDLYYYVTYYSKDVFQIIQITASGVMKYRVIGNATDETHINVVFVIK